MRWVPANIRPVMRLAQPALSGVLALLVLGEPLGWVHVAGGLVVVVGAAGAVLSRDGRALQRAAREGAGLPVGQTTAISLSTSRALRTPTG